MTRHVPPAVCLGILVADVIARPVKCLPAPGALLPMPEIALATGGCAVNTGIAMARLGVPLRIVGKVGSDAFGEFVLSALRADRIDVRGVRRDPKVQTSATVVTVYPSGERGFLHCIGANAALREKDVDWSVMKGAKHLHVAGTFVMPGIDGKPTARILAKARRLGLTTSLDTVWDPKDRWDEAWVCLPHLDYFMPSYEEARRMTGETTPDRIAARCMEKGARTVVLKMGEEGCYIRHAEGEIRVPAFVVPKVVDTTGAGDSFIGGFLTGLLMGWDLERCGRLGNATGAACVQAMGASTGIGNLRQTVKLMRTLNVRAS